MMIMMVVMIVKKNTATLVTFSLGFWALPHTSQQWDPADPCSYEQKSKWITVLELERWRVYNLSHPHWTGGGRWGRGGGVQIHPSHAQRAQACWLHLTFFICIEPTALPYQDSELLWGPLKMQSQGMSWHLTAWWWFGWFLSPLLSEGNVSHQRSVCT